MYQEIIVGQVLKNFKNNPYYFSVFRFIGHLHKYILEKFYCGSECMKVEIQKS